MPARVSGSRRIMPRTASASLLVLLCVSVIGCAAQPNRRNEPYDPFERVNRVTFRFNEAADRAVAKPLAKAYRRVTPRLVRTGVSNFLDNLAYPVTIINDLLQGKIKVFFRDTGRLVINSTVGIGGIFDLASADGLEKNDEDFGQTLGKWGLRPGPYIVIPLLGPSDLRDGTGRIADIWMDPRHYFSNNWWTWSLWGVELVDLRARLLDTDKAFSGVYDRYAFLRNAYLQRRQYLVTDGQETSEQQDEQQYQDEQKIIEESGGADQSPGGVATPAPVDQTKPPDAEKQAPENAPPPPPPPTTPTPPSA
jgi:phospholipid-binding lipoprotein MlaA